MFNVVCIGSCLYFMRLINSCSLCFSYTKVYVSHRTSTREQSGVTMAERVSVRMFLLPSRRTSSACRSTRIPELDSITLPRNIIRITTTIKYKKEMEIQCAHACERGTEIQIHKIKYRLQTSIFALWRMLHQNKAEAYLGRLDIVRMQGFNSNMSYCP